MTPPAMTARSHRVAARPVLNMPLIQARAEALGVSTAHLDSMLGVSLHALARDPDHRGVGLTVLVRLSRVLDLPIDDLVLTDDTQPERSRPGFTPQPEQASDGQLLMGLVASYNSLHVGRVLILLGWTRPRLDAALIEIGGHLEPTALRVVATDERLTLTLRPGVIPARVRSQFDHDQIGHLPLEPRLAVHLLRLVREKILEPFPEHHDDTQIRLLRRQALSHDVGVLLSQRLAVTAPDPEATGHSDSAPTSDPDSSADVEAHPDVMFALGLVDTPAPSPPEPATPPEAR